MNTTERYCPVCGASNKDEEQTCFACGASLDSPEAHIEDHISTAHILKNRYRLLSQIGAGGFSAVYKAEDQHTRRLVAVKAVSLRGLSVQEKIEATDAFNREISILDALHHRNLPRIYDNFTDPECWYLVMDFIDGVTLEKHLEDKQGERLALNEALDLGILLCDVLHYLHTRQPTIIFRDLKPANIMLTRDGHIFLIDFGIARRFKPGQAKDTIPFGSPGYAAPEQYGKTQTTPRADIYSLGAILHQLITGEDPAVNAFSFTPLEDRQQPGLVRLASLIASMTEVDASKRPEEVQKVRRELEQSSKDLHLRHSVYWGSTQPLTSAAPISYQSFYPPPPAGFPGQATGWQTQISANQMQQAQAYPTIPNTMATTSLVLSLIGIFLPPFLCFASTSLVSMSMRGSVPMVGLLVLLMLPSLLGIITGHIGKQRAQTIPGMQHTNDTAVTGMTIGYIFGSLYFLLALCIMMSNVT